MQKRGFLILLGVTLVMVAVAIVALATGPRAAAPNVGNGERALPGLADKLGDLAWLRVAHGSTRVDFAAVGGRWAVVEKGNYPAQPAKVRQLLLGLADLTLIEPKTERPQLFARLDLDDPQEGRATLVTLQDRTGKAAGEIIVGKRRRDRLGSGNDGVYIRKTGEQRTWLARGSLDLPSDAVAWLDRRILDIPTSRIASVTLTGEDGKALVLRREGAAGKFTVADAPADTKFKDTAVTEPAGALIALDLDDVKPAADLPSTENAAKADFVTVDGLTIAVRLFRQDDADWATIDASDTGGAEADSKAINARLARWAFKLPPQRAKLLRTKLADLVESAKGS